jgi:hypothetical protein
LKSVDTPVRNQVVYVVDEGSAPGVEADQRKVVLKVSQQLGCAEKILLVADAAAQGWRVIHFLVLLAPLCRHEHSAARSACVLLENRDHDNNILIICEIYNVEIILGCDEDYPKFYNYY